MKKSYLFGAMALSLLFTGCKDDLTNGPDSNISDKSQTLYINMRIHGDGYSGTRATDENGPSADPSFDAGTKQENAVNNAYFVFYDNDGNVIGEIVPVELDDSHKVTEGEGTSITEYYKSVVPVSVRKGENKPTQVICYINPISPSTLQNPLSIIQTIARERVTTPINGEEYFAMSNSVYYPQEGEGTNILPQVAIPIVEGALCETEDAVSDAPAVDIYVERYASKLAFNGPSAANISTYQTATRKYTGTAYTTVGVSLSFQPQYWALNAQSNTSYVIKSFRRESQEGQVLADNYPYQTLNYRINALDPLNINYDAISGTTLEGNSWVWNNMTGHRSYWSVSPAYFQNEYPEVASDVTAVGVSNQTYLKYADLATKGFSANTNTPKYFKETTVGTKAINSNNPAAAVASVIFVGQYKVSVDGTEIADNPAFYTYLTGSVNIGAATEQRPYVYFESNAQGESVVSGGESMLKRFCAQSTILFKQVQRTENGEQVIGYERLGIGNPGDYNTMVNALAVSEISDAVKNKVGTGSLKLQGNARSLQFKSVDNATGIYIASGNGYKTIVADDADNYDETSQIHISEANAILMQQVGYAYYYNNGKAYFNIPVKHLGWYRKGNANRTDGKDNPKIDWNKVRVGDFGMVRNHSYTINVNKITGLASGIAGDNVPIVPPASTTDYYVSYSVRILPWAVVPVQGVDL